jgi:hypothetical protein
VDRDEHLSDEKKRLSWMRRFIRKLGDEGLDAMDVMTHSIADSYSKKTAPVTQDIIDNYNLLKSQLQMAADNPNVDPATGKIRPVLNGREIQVLLNIGPSRMVGDAIRRVKELMDENPSISKEEATQAIIDEFTPLIPEEEKIRQASSCPKHLLYGKVDDIKVAIKDCNVDKAITLMADLKGESEDDESVYEHIASCMLDTLLIDSNKRNLDLLSYLFKKAERNFFNAELCVPVLGILLLLKTGTDEKVIEEIGERMGNMANNELQCMLKRLPANAHHQKIIKGLRNGRRKRS